MGEIKLMSKVTKMAEILGEKDQAIQLSSQEPAAIFVLLSCVGCVGCLFAIGEMILQIWGVNIRVSLRSSTKQMHHTLNPIVRPRGHLLNNTFDP
jgi:hypothetical protein